MSLVLTFMELDKLYESTLSRQELINNIKASGKNYNLDNKSDSQLFRIWERIQKEVSNAHHIKKYDDAVKAALRKRCPECNTLLNDGGTCPVCADGEEHY